jgi:hypothetical protein
LIQEAEKKPKYICSPLRPVVDLLLNRPDSAGEMGAVIHELHPTPGLSGGLLSIFAEVKAFTRVSLGAAVAGAQSYPGATASSPP